jgi:heat shock protein HtpX
MTKATTVYDHIHKNNIKTIFLVALFPCIFAALIFLFTWFVAPMDDAINTTISVAIPTFAICAIWMLISWAFGDTMMLNIAGAQEISETDKQYRKIFHLVENTALAAGLPTPRIYIINDNSMNAFATGRTPRDASVALTRGIINNLTPAELRGVIAHEMAHIGNRDIRLDMLLITGIGITTFIADIISRGIRFGRQPSSTNDNRDKAGAILLMVWLAFVVFNWFISPILRMAVSRNREYAADATGAHITRDPAALASALRKISTDPRVEALDRITSMSAVCIAFPGHPHLAMAKIMATHPSIENRIARLQSMTLSTL